MTDRELLELAELKRTLFYGLDTGEFCWLVSPNRKIKIGDTAGSINSHGYVHIQINKKFYKAHRLAWFYVTGKWPEQIDHINGVRTDNRICNLRDVTSQMNTHNQKFAHKNNSLGVLGVVKRPSGRFVAEIRVNGKKKQIGTFDTVEEASQAYQTKKLELHKGVV